MDRMRGVFLGFMTPDQTQICMWHLLNEDKKKAEADATGLPEKSYEELGLIPLTISMLSIVSGGVSDGEPLRSALEREWQEERGSSLPLDGCIFDSARDMKTVTVQQRPNEDGKMEKRVIDGTGWIVTAEGVLVNLLEKTGGNFYPLNQLEKLAVRPFMNGITKQVLVYSG